MDCADRSWAVMAEYTRVFLLGRGSTNQVSVLGQVELDRLDTGYLNFVFGPAASFDEDSAPGRGYGGQLGVGHSWRGEMLPLFLEAISSLLRFDSGLAFHAGVNIGLVW